MLSQAIRNLDSSLQFTYTGDIETEDDYKEIKWVVGKDDIDTAVFGKPDSIPTWSEVVAEMDRIKPTIEWEQKMAASDSLMSRDREYAITRLDDGVADNSEEQTRYNAKIALRATKPD